MQVDVAGHAQPGALAAVPRRPEDQLGGHDAIVEDLAVVVDVADEQVERPDPLLEPALDHGPLAGGHQPGDRVEGDDTLDPLAASVDGEGDALLPHREVGQAVATLELVRPQLHQTFMQRRVMRPRAARPLEHLVVARQPVATEEGGLGG